MRPVVTLANQKGGVGKTTTAAALIDGMRRRGRGVLGIDCDPQANLTRVQLPWVADGTATTLDLMKGASVILVDGQASVPADEGLADADVEPDPTTDRPLSLGCLGERAQGVMDTLGLDLAVIDTHPDRGFCAMAACLAATHVIIPAEAEPFAVDGILQELAFLDYLTEVSGIGWQGRTAVTITKYVRNTTMHRSIADQVAEELGDLGVKVFAQRISRRIQIPQAQARGASIYDVEGVARGAVAQYGWLCDEVASWVEGTMGGVA